jgi:hypothetical protein
MDSNLRQTVITARALWIGRAGPEYHEAFALAAKVHQRADILARIALRRVKLLGLTSAELAERFERADLRGLEIDTLARYEVASELATKGEDR